MSGQAKQAFGKVEKSSEKAAAVLGAISKDVFESGMSNQRGAISGASRRAEEKLGEVVEHHGQVVQDLDVLFDADPNIATALLSARREAESLGLPTNATWLLRNSIDSAQREEDYAARSTIEIDRSLTGVESKLESVLSSATELGKTPGRWGSGGLGSGRWRHRHHHRGGGWKGQQFRERWQARVQERRMRARELDDVTSKLDNPFQEIDRSSERGARHQVEVSNHVDQALKWVDQLEREYAGRPGNGRPPAGAPPVARRPSPSPTAPIPILDNPTQPTPPAAQPQPDGFFRKPWRS